MFHGHDTYFPDLVHPDTYKVDFILVENILELELEYP